MATPINMTGTNSPGTMGSGTQNTGATFGEIIPANRERQFGVWLQMTKATEDVMRVVLADSQPGASTVGFLIKAAYTNAFSAGNDSLYFFPGRSALWARDHSGSSADQTFVYYEL